MLLAEKYNEVDFNAVKSYERSEERAELINAYTDRLRRRYPDWDGSKIQEEVDYFFSAEL